MMQFLYPNVLFLLILLAVLIFLITTNKNNFERFFNKDTLDRLLVNTNTINDTTRNILFFFTLILFVLSLARPVMNMKEHKVKQQFIPIVIALDVSKSMSATDIYPSRLSLAKKKLTTIIKNSTNTVIGIVLFAKNSYIVSPITEDFTSLNYIVENLDTTLNFANGSNIFAVLEATKQMLKDYSVKNLIILSDGGNNDEYTNELIYAQENNIAIYTVGLATKIGAPIPTKNGYLTDKNSKIVTVSLNESIKQLALKSGGGYIGFSLDSNDIDAILTQIQKQSKKQQVDTKKVKTYTELFYYPLALGIFCLLIAFSSLPRRKSQLITALISLCFITNINTNANILDFKTLQTAKENYEKKHYKDAILGYKKIKVSNQSNYNLANSYYKNKNYKKAIQTYDKIITSNKELEYKKLHNLGNSYVKTKNLQKAKEFYEKALKLKDDIQTKENLEIVNKALKKEKQKKNKKNKNQKKQDKDKSKDKKESKNKQKNKDKKKQDKTKQSKPSQKELSDMEEKKWMKTLQNKKTPIMLQKVKTKIQNSNTEQPW